MAKVRFTEEQIADFLQQSKNGVPNNVLCEKFGFSPSTLRRWQELHAQRIRGELKQAEKTAAYVFLGFLISTLLLAFIFSKPVASWVIPFVLLYCLCYIRRYRALSAEHIKEGDTSLARSGLGADNVFYQLSWCLIILFLCSLGYLFVHLILR
ncbi:transposase [Phytobacter diazotrophicus]|uniref:transposase n=1 Tax=Phytobacter diazotrophicus TaxID=395631 RepID=UPI0013EAF8DF|nr:transposase [Phytobacter diazotrophicus]MDU7134033.1 transposase [Enterobacteriaceae bacterium]QIH65461.1 transposase [Enterobacteriaceae bacterium A-F18]